MAARRDFEELARTVEVIYLSEVEMILSIVYWRSLLLYLCRDFEKRRHAASLPLRPMVLEYLVVSTVRDRLVADEMKSVDLLAHIPRQIHEGRHVEVLYRVAGRVVEVAWGVWAEVIKEGVSRRQVFLK